VVGVKAPRGRTGTIDEPSFDYEYTRSRRLSRPTAGGSDGGSKEGRSGGGLSAPLLASDAADRYGSRGGGGVQQQQQQQQQAGTAVMSDYRREAMVIRAVSQHPRLLLLQPLPLLLPGSALAPLSVLSLP
jgi:hypothetical protein